MADVGDSDESGRIVNLIEHAPIADAEAPRGWVIVSKQEATGRAGRLSQSAEGCDDALRNAG
jgi:hypothetical protein